MPLQVRFRHSNAVRVLDLPDRDVSHPLVIGSEPGVDLRIPFQPVAPKHAALYMHEGQWIIYGLSGVVTLGGNALSGPAVLQSGDIVSLGGEPSAPTLEIDPARANRADAAALSPAAPPASAARPQLAPAPAPAPARARPTVPPESAPSAAAPAASAGELAAGDDGEDTIEWDPKTPVPSTTQFYIPKTRKTPAIAIIIAVVVGGAAFVALGVYAYQKTRNPRMVTLGQSAPVSPAATTKPKTLFDLNGDLAAARQTQARGGLGAPSDDASSTRNTTTPSAIAATTGDQAPAHPAQDNSTSAAPPPPAHEEAPPDPNDTEWNDIRSAHFNVRHQGIAILKYDEYRRDHPGKFTALLDQFTDEAINWLYWQRVAQLWARQDDLVAQLRQKTRDINNQPAGEFHDTMVKEKAALQEKANQTKELLTGEMGFRGDEPPDLESPKQLKTLIDSRDPAKYAAFRKHVLRYVRDNHGGVWWEGE
jgi:hypothetical protein